MSEAVWERIEESRARNNVLEHPFYVRWSAGELSREELARYAGQYRHATEALARLCERPPRRAPDGHRDEIEAHATEEEAHVGLWDGFVEAAGRRDRRRADCRDRAVRHRPGPRPTDTSTQLARMYAIESGQPEIARVKREGLARFYGIDGGSGSRVLPHP